MSSTRLSLIQRGLQEHHDLVDHFKYIESVEGSESLLDDIKPFATKALSLSSSLSGKAVNQIDQLFRNGSRKVMVKFGTNRQALSVILRDIPKEGVKENYDLPISFINQVTSEGQLSNVIEDAKTLQKTLTVFENHLKELDGYLKLQLGIIKKIGSVKRNEDGITLIHQYDELSYPTVNFPHTEDNRLISHVLPGGKHLEFNKQTHTYSMSGEKPNGSAQALSSESEITTWLKAVEGVNHHLQSLTKYMYDYNSFVKEWSLTVKRVYGELDQQDQISDNVKRQLEKMLNGNVASMQLYSGLLPRLIGYTDKYVQDVLSAANKLLN